MTIPNVMSFLLQVEEPVLTAEMLQFNSPEDCREVIDKFPTKGCYVYIERLPEELSLYYFNQQGIKVPRIIKTKLNSSNFMFSSLTSSCVGVNIRPSNSSCKSNSIYSKAIDNRESDIKKIMFKCHECTYVTMYKGNLCSHVKAVHLKVKPLKCSECDFSTDTKKNLLAHIKAVHLKLKPFKCSDCDHRTSKKSHLLRHVKAVHLKQKPFKCDECDYYAADKHTTLYICLNIHLAACMHTVVSQNK